MATPERGAWADTTEAKIELMNDAIVPLLVIMNTGSSSQAMKMP